MERRDRFSGVNSPEESTDKRLVGFDEAEITVRVLLIMAAANPKAKSPIRDRHHPTPIFSERFLGLKSFSSQTVSKELRQSFPPQSRIDLLLFAFVRRKSVGTELDMRQHDSPTVSESMRNVNWGCRTVPPFGPGGIERL
jgi:hypothetical protein